MKKIARTFLFALFVAGAAGLLNGCASDDPGDLSAIPWNKPGSWEGPMPSTINNGR
jgi:hypothetical protein